MLKAGYYKYDSLSTYHILGVSNSNSVYDTMITSAISTYQYNSGIWCSLMLKCNMNNSSFSVIDQSSYCICSSNIITATPSRSSSILDGRHNDVHCDLV